MHRFSRAMWTLFELIHAVTYFAPEPRAAYEAAGLRGFWRGYFAGRAAPLGAVGAAPVVALFGGFAPSFVQRALPAVWSLTPPEVALEVRRRGAAEALRRVVPEAAEAARAASDLERAVDALALAGRALGSANAALPRPDDPHERLWQAATTLREHRGDGHVAALVTAGIAGLDVLVLRCGLDVGRVVLQPARGWTDPEWEAAARSLTERELLAGDATLTDAGRRLVAEVEEATDRAASSAWANLDANEIVLAAQRLSPIAAGCEAELPDRWPIGTLIRWDPVSDPTAATVRIPGFPSI